MLATEPSAPAEAPTAAPAHLPEPMPSMPRDRLLLLFTGLAGSLLINLVGQFTGSNLADIQGAIGATADDGSWLVTGYTMAFLSGIVFAGPLIGTFGIRRYVAASALVFAIAALGCASAPGLPWMVALRALQGFVAGGFGPVAFVAVFTTTAGPRLPFGLSVLAFVLVLPTTLGPAAAGYLEESLGWEALFLVQTLVGAGLACAALFFMPRVPTAWGALRRDWSAVILLALAMAASALVLGQGTRRYWLDSVTVNWGIAVAAACWAGFLFALWRSPMPILDVGLVARRTFGAPILLNLVFRAALAFTVFLVPQFLALVQGYRPLEIGRLFAAAAAVQVLVFPLVWWLLQRLDGRFVLGSGLFLFGLGALLAADATSLSSADQFRLGLLLAGAGQVLFLVPNLLAGGRSLTPADGPTASLMFNATTLGGTTIGVALAAELVTERQKFHLQALAEAAAAYGARPDRLELLAGRFASAVGDDAAASGALAAVAGALRREALVLSFNDTFLAVAGLLFAAVALGMLLIRPQPPLGGSPTIWTGGPS